MSNLNLKIEKSQHDSLKASIVAATCQIILEQQIHQSHWKNVLNSVQSFFKKTNYELNLHDLKKQFDYDYSFSINSLNNIPNISNIDVNIVIEKAIYWMAYINKNSARILAVQNKEKTMRGELALSINNITSYILPTMKNKIVQDDFNEIIENALKLNAYANNLLSRKKRKL